MTLNYTELNVSKMFSTTSKTKQENQTNILVVYIIIIQNMIEIFLLQKRISPHARKNVIPRKNCYEWRNT